MFTPTALSAIKLHIKMMVFTHRYLFIRGQEFGPRIFAILCFCVSCALHDYSERREGTCRDKGTGLTAIKPLS